MEGRLRKEGRGKRQIKEGMTEGKKADERRKDGRKAD